MARDSAVRMSDCVLLLSQVGFQKILTLTYVDKFIDDVQMYFRDRYKNELEQRGALKFLLNNFEFGDDFHRLLRWARPFFWINKYKCLSKKDKRLDQNIIYVYATF